MDLYLSLLSPVWWATVLVCTVALTAATSWLARGAARRSGPAQAARSISHRRMRLAAWTVVLLVLANLSMLCTMVAANLRTPNLAGPVGLAFVLCCLVSLVLAVIVHGAARRH
jgi:hypothetical protein